MSDDTDAASQVISKVTESLGDRAVAIYSFGHEFGRGPKGPSTRLLLLVDAIDLEILDTLTGLQRVASEHDTLLRVDTAENLQASTDVFPVLTSELIDTRALLHGTDVLESLVIHPRELRMGIEHSLRATRRDLTRAYLDALEDRPRAVELRRAARRAVMMLEATLRISGEPVPDSHDAAAILASAKRAGLIKDHADTWDALRRFGSYEDVLERDALVALHAKVILAIAALIDTVDQLEPVDS